MQYLLDTVTLVRHFTEIGKLGKKAQELLNSNENTFVISVVSLMEILYLSEKRRKDESIRLSNVGKIGISNNGKYFHNNVGS